MKYLLISLLLLSALPASAGSLPVDRSDVSIYTPDTIKNASREEIRAIIKRGYKWPTSPEANGVRERICPITGEVWVKGVVSDPNHPENLAFTRDRDLYYAATMAKGRENISSVISTLKSVTSKGDQP